MASDARNGSTRGELRLTPLLSFVPSLTDAPFPSSPCSSVRHVAPRYAIVLHEYAPAVHLPSRWADDRWIVSAHWPLSFAVAAQSTGAKSVSDARCDMQCVRRPRFHSRSACTKRRCLALEPHCKTQKCHNAAVAACMHSTSDSVAKGSAQGRMHAHDARQLITTRGGSRRQNHFDRVSPGLLPVVL